MELWDAYKADGTLAGFDLVRGEKIPTGFFHMVCEAVIQHAEGDYLIMQRSFEKDIYPGAWEIGAEEIASFYYENDELTALMYEYVKIHPAEFVVDGEYDYFEVDV